MIPRFRAWDKETKSMNGMAEIYRNRNQEIELHPRDENIILTQSTGLRDKNEREIFEGDILCDEGIEQGSEFVFVAVSYRDGMWVCDQITSDGCGYGGALNEFSDDYSVIGNIYENPELLEAN